MFNVVFQCRLRFFKLFSEHLFFIIFSPSTVVHEDMLIPADPFEHVKLLAKEFLKFPCLKKNYTATLT